MLRSAKVGVPFILAVALIAYFASDHDLAVTGWWSLGAFYVWGMGKAHQVQQYRQWLAGQDDPYILITEVGDVIYGIWIWLSWLTYYSASAEKREAAWEFSQQPESLLI